MTPFTPSAHYLIACERERQVFKLGYDSAHDDQHKHFELAKAAQCYLDIANGKITGEPISLLKLDSLWPWGPECLSPGNDAASNLVKAGALFTAEKMRIWRTGDKVLAASYDASINECARLLTIELGQDNAPKPDPIHEAARFLLKAVSYEDVELAYANLHDAVNNLDNPLAPPV